MLRWALAGVPVALAGRLGWHVLLAPSPPPPTSNRPYWFTLFVFDHYPQPAVSGNDKTWVFMVENNGTIYGCAPGSGKLNVTLTGQADTSFSYFLGVPCPG